MSEEGKKKVGEEVEKIDEKGAKIELRKTEEAIAHGMAAIELFGDIMLDDKRRQGATVGAGSVVGAVVNTAMDAKEETDEEKREKLLEVGTTSVLEMSHGFMSVILAGARRRREKKKASEIQGKVKVVEEKKV